VRNPVRKFLGVALIGLLGVFVAAPAIAGAQTEVVPGEGAPASPGICSFSVTPAEIPVGGTQLTVTGVVPIGAAQVQVFYNADLLTFDEFKNPPAGVTPVGVGTPDASGNFSITPGVVVTTATDVAVNYTFGNKNFYATLCSNPAGANVTRINVAGETVARPLAFTGSSETPTYVLVGLGAIAVGLVFVVAARRRSRVHG
jgi:LPXTG-motif cell wall-anchored protein